LGPDEVEETSAGKAQHAFGDDAEARRAGAGAVGVISM
jgi:hypothetical protein